MAINVLYNANIYMYYRFKGTLHEAVQTPCFISQNTSGIEMSGGVKLVTNFTIKQLRKYCNSVNRYMYRQTSNGNYTG